MCYVYVFAYAVYGASAYTSSYAMYVFFFASLVDCFGLCLLLLGVLHVCDSSFSLSMFVLVGYGVYGVSAYGSSYGSGCLVSTLFWFMFLFARGVACFLLIISFIIFCFACCVDDISDLFFVHACFQQLYL